MNQILIWEPRWHDQVVLVADRRLLEDNEIVIGQKDAKGHPYFPRPLYITGSKAKEYPLEYMNTKAGGKIAVRAIPLAELEKEVIEV